MLGLQGPIPARRPVRLRAVLAVLETHSDDINSGLCTACCKKRGKRFGKLADPSKPGLLQRIQDGGKEV